MPRCPRWAVGFPPSLEGSGGQGRCCLRVLRTAGGDAHAGAESWLQPSALVPPEPGAGRACRAPVGLPMTAGGAGSGRQTPSHGLCAHWVLYPPRSPRRWRSRAFPRFPVEGPAARTRSPGLREEPAWPVRPFLPHGQEDASLHSQGELLSIRFAGSAGKRSTICI